MADLEMIRLVSLKTGLGMKFVSKEERLSSMISQLGSIFEGKTVIMKGGTALNRIYIKKRFSEDIDLDFISGLSKARKLRIVDTLMKKVEGFRVEKPRKMGEVFRYDCFYTNDFGEKDKIRVEFNLSCNRLVSAEKPKKTVINSFILPTKASSMLAYSLEDMIARKLGALLGREEGKDIFDLFYALDLAYKKHTLRRAINLVGLGNADNIKMEAKKKLETIKERTPYIRDSTSHYIPVSMRPEWKGFINTLIYKLGRI